MFVNYLFFGYFICTLYVVACTTTACTRCVEGVRSSKVESEIVVRLGDSTVSNEI